eukprot:scaffold11207_cov133-Isochrysis_galbana.AAC.2
MAPSVVPFPPPGPPHFSHPRAPPSPFFPAPGLTCSAPEYAGRFPNQHSTFSTGHQCSTPHTTPVPAPPPSEEDHRRLLSHARALQRRLTALSLSAEALHAALDTARADAADARRKLKIATGDRSLLGGLGLSELEGVEAQAVGTLCAVLPLLQRARSEAGRANNSNGSS